MVNRTELENRIIPYKMLLEATSTMLELTDRILSDTAMPSLIVGLQCLKAVLTDCIEKAGEGLPIVGYHFAFPSDFLFAYDCVPVCIEGISYMLAAILPEGGIHKYFDMINNYGHPFHTCSAQKGVMGMTLDNLIHFDAIITPTAPCDNTCASYPFFELKKKFPVIITDMPFQHDEESFEYCGKEIKRGLEEVGAIIGQEPDYNKMKEHIKLENSINKTKTDIFELKKAIPCPVENMSNALSAAAHIFMAGREEKATFYKSVLETSKQRLKAGVHHGGEERIRSIWPYMLTFFNLDLCEWLDRHLGMSILFDVFNYSFDEPIELNKGSDALFYGMGKKLMQYPMTRQSSQFYYPFLEECVRFAKEFSADCFIYTSSIACKQFGSIPFILKNLLQEEVGIPMLIIDLDVADPRITNLETVREKILTFTQTLL